jgi:ankyrin repeat protein
VRNSVLLSFARPLRCVGGPRGLTGRPWWLYLLSTAVIVQFCTAPPVVAAVYECVGPDGSTSYSDTPCAANAARVEVQTNPDRASATARPDIQSAAYASPRNGRSIDVTNQVKSLCRDTPGSCAVSCGNQLAGDPDFGQRKYCRIAYVCGGGKAQELRIQEGERSTLSCSADVATTTPQNAPPSANRVTASPSSYRETDRLVTLVREGSIEKLAAYLAAPGADINARPDVDKALLDYAAEQNQIAVATWLLDHGANVNGEQQTGRHVGLTALHRAAFFDSFEVAQLLIARGADVNANRSRGSTPLFYAASGGHGRIVELLLRNGADIQVRAAAGTTAVSTAAQQGHLDILKVLEAHGATLNDDRVLPEAAFNQHADVVRYLLGHDQSQIAKDSALRFAVLAADSRTEAASLDLVSMLIAAGANVNNTVNAAPNTPLMMAKRSELRELLLAHGALDFTAVRSRQTVPPSVNPVAASAPSYGANGGVSAIEQSNLAAMNGPKASPASVGSPDAVALAKIVQVLGGGARDDQSISFDMFAALQMRVIAPDDPGWKRSNPRWVALFNTVKQDLTHDVEPALEASLADGVRELGGVLEARLTAGDVRQLLAFYRSDRGQRYIAFQKQIGAIQAQGIAQLTAGLMGAGASPAPSDGPSKDRLNARRRVLTNSWGSLIVSGALSSALGPTSNTQEPGPGDFLNAVSDVAARTHGPEIDALEQRYASDLPQFEAFHRSPAAKSLLSAMKAAFQQAAARPEASAPFKDALERSIAQHTPSWRAMYEAGRSSTATPQADSSHVAGATPVAPTTPASASAANGPGNVQIEQHGRVTSVTIPGQLAPTQTLGCVGLEKVKSTSTPPDLYNASRACVDQGDYDDAARLFLLGGAYGRFDAARVADKTAGQGLTILITGFGNGLGEEQKQAFTAATSKFQTAENRERLCGQFKRLGPPNYFPRYMILHGIKAFTATDPTADALDHDFDAAATWQHILTEGLTCTADQP